MTFDFKAERLNRGLSLDALAAETGVAKSTLARVEKGGPQPNPANAKAIADYYGVAVTDLWPVEERVA